VESFNAVPIKLKNSYRDAAVDMEDGTESSYLDDHEPSSSKSDNWDTSNLESSYWTDGSASSSRETDDWDEYDNSRESRYWDDVSDEDGSSDWENDYYDGLEKSYWVEDLDLDDDYVGLLKGDVESNFVSDESSFGDEYFDAMVLAAKNEDEMEEKLGGMT
jgi:hypothetical protein